MALLEIENITKQISGRSILQGITLNIEQGETHGIVGANGAGKTVLTNIISGVYPADSGGICFDGQRLLATFPAECIRLGIVTVRQESHIFPNLSITENIFASMIGQPEQKFRSIRWRGLRRAAEEILETIHLEVNPDSLAANLNPGERQALKIARALTLKPKLLILDEPAPSLGDAITESISRALKTVKKQGTSIMYISHDIDSILQKSDEITVIKNGMALAVNKNSSTRDAEVRRLLDIESKIPYPRLNRRVGREIFMAKNLYIRDNIGPLNFCLRKGEILGITGELGEGKSSIGRCLFGLDKPASGSMMIDGQGYQPRNPADALKLGIAYLPEDRMENWLLADQGIPANLSLINPYETHSRFLLHPDLERNSASHFTVGLNIKTPSIEAPIRTLSGGNQQKVAIAKLLFASKRILIFDEPTRELDTVTKIEFYNLLNRLAGDGVSIIFISSNRDELAGMCNRVLRLHGGSMQGLEAV